MFINLLPANTRLKIQFRSMLRRFARIWCLAGIGAVACGLAQAWQYWHTAQTLAALEARCQPLYGLQEQIQKDHQQLKKLEAQRDTLTHLQPPDHFMDLLGVLVQTTRAELGRLHIQRMTLQAAQNAAPVAGKSSSRTTASAPAPTAGSTTSIVSLNGQADDDAALARFVSTLRETSVFTRVDLKSSSQVSGGTGTARQYQLECRYEELR